MRELNLSLLLKVRNVLDVNFILKGVYIFPGVLDRASTALKNTWVLKAII